MFVASTSLLIQHSAGLVFWVGVVIGGRQPPVERQARPHSQQRTMEGNTVEWFTPSLPPPNNPDVVARVCTPGR
jgi:hypothetical protein